MPSFQLDGQLPVGNVVERLSVVYGGGAPDVAAPPGVHVAGGEQHGHKYIPTLTAHGFDASNHIIAPRRPFLPITFFERSDTMILFWTNSFPSSS